MNHKMFHLRKTDQLLSHSNTGEKLPRSSKSQYNNVRRPIINETTKYRRAADRLNLNAWLKNANKKTTQIHRKGNATKEYSIIGPGIETNLFSRSLEKITSQDSVPDNPPIDEKSEDCCTTCKPAIKTEHLLKPKLHSYPAIGEIPAGVSVQPRVPLASEPKLTKTIIKGSSNRDEFKTQPDQSVREGCETCNVRNYKQKKSWMGAMSSRHLPDFLVQKSKGKPKMTDEVLDTCFQSEEFKSLDALNVDVTLTSKDRRRDIFPRSISLESFRKETMRETNFSLDGITPSKRAQYSAKNAGDIERQNDAVVSAPLLPIILSDPLVSEFWRLTTFQDVVDVPVFVQRLAQSGFYYNQQNNDIRCFSCGVSKRHWQQWEKPALIHLHLSPNCPQANSRDSRNIPITTMHQPRVTRTGATSSSDQTHLTGDNGNNSVTSMQNPAVTEKEPNFSSKDSNSSNSTEFRSKNMGSVSVMSFAEVVSSSSSAAPRTVASPYEATEVICQLERASLSREEDRTDGEQAIEEGHDHRALLVASDSSLSRPAQINPCDVNFSQRLLTFTTWPNSTLAPTELAEAGFSYLGTGDSVRCFSCSLTLKNWTGDLTPWVAHVVYRSSCDYLLSVKGEDFVRSTLVTFGRAQHKAVGNSSRTQTHEATSYFSHVSHTREASATGSKLHSLAADAGVPCDSGSLTSGCRPAMTGTRIQLDAVREVLTCKLCRHREVDTVLLPCGHLCACSACASDMTQCLVCLQTVMATVLVQRE